MTAHGEFYWNELMTRDVEKAKEFYAKAVGWTFDAMPMPEGTYHVAMQGDKPVGGIMDMTGPDFEGRPEMWMSYLSVDDIDARLKKAESGGAKILKEPFDVPGVGRIAMIMDGGNAVIGWMTPAQQ